MSAYDMGFPFESVKRVTSWKFSKFTCGSQYLTVCVPDIGYLFESYWLRMHIPILWWPLLVYTASTRNILFWFKILE